MAQELDDLIAVIETWQTKRISLATKGENGGFTKDGLHEFAETMNALTRKLISLTRQQDPEFWSAWLELGQNASTMTHNAKLVVDKIDRTTL